jgi:hypothetical protein
MSGLFVSNPNSSGHATDHFPGTDLGIYAWDWLNTEQMEGGYVNQYLSAFANMDLTVDIFCTFDANVKPVQPPGSPTLFFPDAGNVVFRSGWDKEATYLLLLGEKGNMRLMGGTHEHPDAGSFVIFSHGELLALDAGYPGYPQHELVNQAKNHSVILVDGQGPVAIDAELSDFFDSPQFDFATIKMNYGGANIVRNIAFIENQYVAIIDQLDSDLTHEFAWLLHGNAGGTLTNTSFTKTDKGGIWKRPKASLEAYVISDRGVPIYEAGEDYHSLTFVSGNNPLPKHAMLKVRQSSNKLRLASILAPLPQGVGSPAIIPIETKGGMCLKVEQQNSSPVFCAVKSDLNVTSFETDFTTIPEISTDAEIVLVKLSAQSDLPSMLFAKNVTKVAFKNKDFVAAKQKCSIFLNYDENQKIYSGEVQGYDNNSLVIKVAAKNAKVSGAKSFIFQPGTETLQIDFDKPKPFRIEIAK